MQLPVKFMSIGLSSGPSCHATFIWKGRTRTVNVGVWDPRRKGEIYLMPFKAVNSVRGCRRDAPSEEAQVVLNTLQPTTAAEQPGGMQEREDCGTVRGLGNTILGFFFYFLS